MKMVTGGSCALLLALTTHGHALKAASSCESLSSLALPNTSITLAKTVAAGAFTLPETGPAVPQFSQLPTFCRVAATLTPSSDSDIKIEVWLRLGGNHQLWRAGLGAAGGLRDGIDRHRTRRWKCLVCDRTSRKGRRFRVSRRPRDGCEIEGHY